MRDMPPVEIRGRWYGDYPYRTDERLKIPRSVYSLQKELSMRAEIESLDWDGECLRGCVNALIRGIGAPERDTQRLKVIALRKGPLKRVRIRLTGIKLPATIVHRPDVTATAPQRLADLSWSGFEASLDPRKLRRGGRWRQGVWELFVVIRTGKVHRRRSRFFFNRLRPIRGVEIPLPGGVMAKAVPTGGGGVQIDVRTQWSNVTGHGVDGDVLELTGEAHGPQGDKPRLELIRRADEKTFKYPVKIEGEGSPARFTARVKLNDLLESGHAAGAEDEVEDAGEEPDAEEVED